MRSHKFVSDILRKYNIDYDSVLPVQRGYRNLVFPIKKSDSTLLNLIIYKNEDNIISRITTANSISNYLAFNGLPVRRTYDDRILVLKSISGIRHVSLYEYLHGDTIPWDAYTRQHIKLLGQYMAKIHTQLKGQVIQVPSVEEEYLQICSRMQLYFSDNGVKSALGQKLGITIEPNKVSQYIQILKLSKKLKGRQLLHMDFVRSNILFSEKEKLDISGIIDFEKAAFGHPIFDIARTLAFLYVDCNKPPVKIHRYFLIDGYIRHGKGKFSNILFHHTHDLLTLLIEIFWFYDFYKFLRHNPYEDLAHNKHFHKTKEFLLTSGAITAR
ncbi:MAG TPA: phosphotransferase [Candidatus Saccharimonadales bacterium]|nr:phosphotransferase [Candidatus Saccharimonadales bacterium]